MTMNRPPSDQAARDRFTNVWGINLAVVANAGSGKTTAISERLAAMALSDEGAEMLRRTTVVTYTKKAAAQIGQRARSVLLRRMHEEGRADVEPLARLDRAFFGTIHSFCLLLARRHGSTLGLHMNPTLVEDDEEAPWQEFLEQDPMTFESLSANQVGAFLRHASLDEIFDLARGMSVATARQLAGRRPACAAPSLAREVLDEILAKAPTRKGSGADALLRNKETARRWIDDNVEVEPWQRLGDVIAVEPRCIGEPWPAHLGNSSGSKGCGSVREGSDACGMFLAY